MQNFFHADTSKARTVCEKASVAVGAVLALPALLSLMSLIIQTRMWRTEGFLAAGLAVPAICVAVWLAFTFLLFFICETRSRRIKRCTYFEIQKSAAILSRYGGKISADTGGIQRRLYIIPYDEMKLSVKKGRLVFTGKIRCYEGDSDRLGYHIRQGKPEFDSWWLNENGFREISSLTLPLCFPITSSITPMETISQKKQTESTDDGEATFFDVFESLVKNVKETDAQVQKDSVDLMLGDVDDLAQIQVNLEKAATAVDLLVTVKNKAVDAYNEIMRMTV